MCSPSLVVAGAVLPGLVVCAPRAEGMYISEMNVGLTNIGKFISAFKPIYQTISGFYFVHMYN